MLNTVLNTKVERILINRKSVKLSLLPSDCAISGQYRKYAVLIGSYLYQQRSVQTRTDRVGLATYKW